MSQIIENMLMQGETMSITAPAKCGLSWLTLSLVKAFVSGTTWLERRVEKKEVLYINTELEAQAVARRFAELGIDSEDLGLRIVRGLPRVGRGGRRCETALEHVMGLNGPVEVIIVDNGIDLFNDIDINDAEAVSERTRKIQARIGQTSLIMTFTGRKALLNEEYSRGIGAIERFVDTMLSIKPSVPQEQRYSMFYVSRSFMSMGLAQFVKFKYPHWEIQEL